MPSLLRGAMWFVGVPLVALAGGFGGFFPVFTMGLVTPLYLVGPLALLTGALLATLSAAWLANLAAWGETRSRLLAIFGTSVLGLIAGLVANMALVRVIYAFVSFRSLWPAVAGWALCGLILAVVTTAAARRLRRPPGSRLGPLGWVALALSGAWAVILPLDEGLAYQLGLVGAGFGPVISLQDIVVVSLVLAVGGAALLAWHAYRPGDPAGASRGISGAEAGSLNRDAAWTLMLVGLAPALVVGVIFVGCQLTYCGA